MMTKRETARIREMLLYRRPHNSKSESDFINRYIDSIPGVYADGYGNRILICEGSKVMISCHTDSVHSKDGRQKLSVSRIGTVSLAPDELISNCLGADDCAGIYAALRMIEAGVKATFVFHRNEERGGHGSTWLATNYPAWCETFDVCLALDRRGTKDVIVTQSWGKCASNEFALGLAAQLDMGHKPADGIFTDSANYVDLIPECSNLSIGYQREHTSFETLDLGYLDDVIGRLIAVNWDEVPIARTPGDNGYNPHDDYAGWDDIDFELDKDVDLDDDRTEAEKAEDREWDEWIGKRAARMGISTANTRIQ